MVVSPLERSLFSAAKSVAAVGLLFVADWVGLFAVFVLFLTLDEPSGQAVANTVAGLVAFGSLLALADTLLPSATLDRRRPLLLGAGLMCAILAIARDDVPSVDSLVVMILASAIPLSLVVLRPARLLPRIPAWLWATLFVVALAVFWAMLDLTGIFGGGD